jgi:integrase
MAEQQLPLKAARDKALLLVGFAGAFRRSELVVLTVSDLTEHENGIELLLRRSKTDQEGEGRTIFIPHAKGKRCPVAALKEWLTLAGIAAGPLFRSVNRHDQVRKQGLRPQAVATIIKQVITKTGRDPKDYSGHSLRAGYVTTAAVQGLQPWQIKEQTGHKSDAVLARYIRPINKRKLPSLL